MERTTDKLWGCKPYLTTDFRQIHSHHRTALQPTTFTKKDTELNPFLPTALLLTPQNIITGARACDRTALILGVYLLHMTVPPVDKGCTFLILCRPQCPHNLSCRSRRANAPSVLLEKQQEGSNAGQQGSTLCPRAALQLLWVLRKDKCFSSLSCLQND